MRRRDFVTIFGGAATTLPISARAQQPAIPVIGYLTHERPGIYAMPDFLKGLSDNGFVEGQNVTIDYHWANGDYGLFPALTADFVHRRVAVIFTLTTPAVWPKRPLPSQFQSYSGLAVTRSDFLWTHGGHLLQSAWLYRVKGLKH